MAIAIRPYRETDRPTVRELTVSGFEGVSIDHGIDRRLGPIAGRDWRWRKSRDIDRDIDELGANLAVAEDEESGAVVGYVTMQCDAQTRIGWIHNMAVASAARGSGLGRRLLEHALTHFRAAGMTVAKIETLEQNAIGSHLYPSLGFVEVARQIHYAMPLGIKVPMNPGPSASELHDATGVANAGQPPRLEMRHIAKNFGGVRALRDVSLTCMAGEVHALCGENGAGKSTLMKVLAGAITEYDGEIHLDGRPVRFSGPREAEDTGIRIIYQELNLVPQLTVADNIFLGRERVRGGWLGWLDERAMEDRARRLFDRLGTPISPRARVGDLRIGDQQMVEIAKALAFEASIVIMDEPTSALSDSEVARLFRVIDDLKRSGATVVYISHKMNEVFRLADRVTVLRDGQFVNSATRAQITPDQVVRWMVGREIAALEYRPHSIQPKAILEVENLSLPRPPRSGLPSLQNITFTIQAGEVVGVAGLLGAGRTELLEAIYGATPSSPTGTIRLEGRPVRFKHPDDAIRAGVAMVTEDRKSLGLFSQMTVAENITLRHLRDLTVGALPLINPRAERKAVEWSIKELSIKTAGGGAPITSLSGGNQQKCIIARWLLVEPRLLLLDEPTRGIDVGAKSEIYQLIRRLAAQGRAILMTSSELPELLAVADRIIVLCEGRVTAEIPRAEATEESIMHAATRFLEKGKPAAAALDPAAL